MADNNLALGRHDGPDLFADDDPLAELARIVGYEGKPSRPAAPAVVPRREPEFNLEDELMREFERFDAPRLDPANDIGAGFAADPVRTPPAAPVAQPRAVGEIRPAPERFEPVVAMPSEPRPVVDRPAENPGPALQHIPFALSTTAPSMPIQSPVAVDGPVNSPSAAPAFAEVDLVAELETSLTPVSQPDARIEADGPASSKPANKGYTPGFRMPLANFHRVAETPRAPLVEPVRAPEPTLPQSDVAAAPAAADIKPQGDNESIWSSLERELTGDFAPMAAARPAAPPVAAAPPISIAAPSSSAAPVNPVVAESRESGLSAVDMRREPVVDAPVSPFPVAPVVAAPVAPTMVQPARLEPTRIEPAVAMPATEASFEKPAQLNAAPAVVETPAPAAVFSPVEEMRYDTARYSTTAQPAAVAVSQPAVVAGAATDADLIDDEFELALDDLELDLSEFSFGAAEPAAPASPVSAPVQMQAARAPVSAAPSFEQPAASAPSQDEPGDADADLFDPALIADSDEHVESMIEMDVPELPAEEPVVLPKHDTEFDIDLDAELANLLQVAAPAAPSLVRGGAAQPASPLSSRATPTPPAAAPISVPLPVSVAKPTVDNDLDDFERALEEDFRRSLATPLPNSGRRADEDDDAYAFPVARRQVRWGMPVAVVGLLLMGGLSAYAFYASGVPGKAASGKPLVIAADKEPVKIAPENPGGKTVPNQDKAVYERVAGDANDKPKQGALISSNEEPMDVVQKTLASDNLPLQGEEEAITEADSQDARLLPQQADAGAGQAGEQPVSVMPRKVRTMVVRADGTLVEQEVTAPSDPAQQIAQAAAAAARPAASEKLPAQPALAEPTASVPPASVAVAKSAAVSQPAAATASIPVAPAAQAQVVKADVPAAPVPSLRPSEQPVNVVASVSDRGTVQPSSKPAASTQVASVGPGGYFIQVASLPSQAEAEKSYQSLSSKFGNVIGGRGVDIKAAEIAGKGTFYRVRIPAGSKDQAVSLCEDYRSAGGSCLVAR